MGANIGNTVPARLKLMAVLPPEPCVGVCVEATTVRFVPIRITVKTVSGLDDLPDYDCVSYTWGDATDKRPITVDWRTIFVTRNLWDALHRVEIETRGHRLAYAFWADQICINQECDEEKGDQVPLMSQIFRKATRVLCWLGEEDDTTQQAICTLDGWSDAREDEALRLKLSRDLTNTIRNGPGGMSVEQHALERLFSRSWFRRMWTLQEVFVPQDAPPLVMCGSYKISWNRVAVAFTTMGATLGIPDMLMVVGHNNYDHVIAMMNTYLANDNSDNHDWMRMSTLLPNTRLRETSNARDRMYALVGISELEGFRYPKPTYEEEVTTELVYISYTRAIIEQEKCLDILSIKKRTLPVEGTPSWVFDPSNATGAKLLGRRGTKERSVGATGSTEPKLTQSVSPYETSLELYGVDLGCIATISGFDAFWDQLDRSSSRWKDIVSQGRRLADTLNMSDWYVATAEDSFAAVLKTLAINDDWVACPAAARTYRVERKQLYASYILWKDARMDNGLDVAAGAEPDEDESTRDLTPDKIFRLAQDIFQFDRTRHQDSIQYDAEVINWLDAYVSEHVRLMFADTLDYMTLAVTDKGLLALVPHTSKHGDKVCVLLGGFSSFVLRGVGKTLSYRLLGPAYVHGSANGGFVQKYEAEHDASVSERFTLV